jgi:putative membrane protein
MQQPVHFSLGVDWLWLIGIVGALYYLGLRRMRTGPPHPAIRTAAFYGGLGLLLVAFISPLDSYDGVSLFAHTAQHLMLLFGVAPLVALGAPITVLLRASPAKLRQRVLLPVLKSRIASLVAHPWVALSVFVSIQSATLLTSFFNSALTNSLLHNIEHGLYLLAGFLFWWPIFAVDPVPDKPSFQVRISSLALALPVVTAIGLVIYLASAPLYAHYAALPLPWGGRGALVSQHRAGLLTWIAGDAALLAGGAMLIRGRAHRERKPAEPPGPANKSVIQEGPRLPEPR